ncbi:MAG: arsenate reductase (glutaredoxin) [Gammaproteobacteria bacterium]|nr:arsenate reductase (glutaredoxin) [Gammaproteobacteria bacterium]
MKVTIYHNPRCSKSRATLKLIEEQGYAPLVVEYLKTPPSVTTLKKLLKQLGLKPRELLRRNEAAYKDAALDQPGKSDEEVLAAMVKYPILIERPIVVVDDKAVIGRPPENVLEILE